MTAQIGDDGLDLFGDPLPELLTEIAGVQPQPGGEWVHLKDKLGFRSIQRLVIRDTGSASARYSATGNTWQRSGMTAS